ncbi:MAG: sulfatase family protein [Aurantibacter sp.]
MKSIRTKLVYGIFAFMLTYSCKKVEEQTVKPNIIMIMVDQMRFDRLGAMGDKVIKTPNIDALALEGLLFKNGYCPSPVCAPSRAAIQTGLFPPASGIVTNWVPFKEKVAGTTNIDRYFLAKRLKTQGYYTAMVGKLHFYPADANYGFDHKMLSDAPYSVYSDDDKYSEYVKWLDKNHFKDSEKKAVDFFDEDENNYKALGRASSQTDSIYKFIMGSGWRTEEQHDIPWSVQESMKFIVDNDSEKPFFLFTSIFGPHQPYLAPAPWDTMYKPEDIVLGPRFYENMENSPIFQMSSGSGKLAAKLKKEWDEHRYKEILAAYYGQISMIDHYLGKMFDLLKEQGMWENTWIVFVADHGDFNSAYGTFFKGQMYDVSAKIPFIIKPAQGHEGKKTSSQLVSSIDLYGTLLDIAGDQEWKSLPQIESKSLLPIFEGENTLLEEEDKVYSIIGNNPDENLCMLRWGSLKIMRKGITDGEPIYELYDFDKDPFETQNLYGEPEYMAVQEKLRSELDSWWKKQAERYPVKLDQSFRN